MMGLDLGIQTVTPPPPSNETGGCSGSRWQSVPLYTPPWSNGQTIVYTTTYGIPLEDRPSPLGVGGVRVNVVTRAGKIEI